MLLLDKQEDWSVVFNNMLEEMKSLPHDWNGQGSDPPNSISIHNTQDILGLLHIKSFPPQKISPSAENGVSLSFFINNHYAIIECFNSGEIILAISKEKREPLIWEVGNISGEIDDALDRLIVVMNT